ncbi:DMT transporter permease [Stutzerimonas chloritidismutans AW-1]|jgi:drug/metabolite transporter (DMT)-like permease|uniref:DMT transporter permease n=1 Tax=Stutzerimonas chloritidismutans AW-1 TaxID=1263865 RepID=V4PTF0_STUCH|nr:MULTISPECIES: DMT family transporter [Stutzerimonas stutzeri subgroup]ESQ99475.1 DMT transporter permease [Stutzerimonas chloritidismutans AW-1]OHC15507.1 MAG: multidrug DMT transporter permease [Pseudomonadales bacterium GWC2_63_15]PNG00517.1 EamA family transporter [Stutzerimonas kunmingensis]HCG38274.1 EamA family transporter [Pseudomonas sp.]
MRPLDMFRLLALAAIWGASFLFLRIIAPVLGTFPTAFFRVLLATAGLLVILLLLRTRWDFRGKLGLCLVLGVINSGLPFALYSVAAQLVPAGYSAIFNATTPMMGVLIGALFFAEELTLAKIIGVFSGLGGVALLMRIGPVPFDTELLLGALACLGATACYGFGGFLTRRWINQGEGLDSEVVAFGSQLGAALCLLPLFGLSLLNAPPVNWGDSTVWLSLLGLGLVCTAFAYILYFRLLADIGPVKTLTVTFLIPPFGVLWGVIFLDEPLSWAYVQGGALIALALWLILRQAPTTRPTAQLRRS